MKSRHAAAVALVGWSLMVAPAKPGSAPSNIQYDVGAPFSKWTSYGSFSTAAECDEARKPKAPDRKITITGPPGVFLNSGHAFTVPEAATKYLASDSPDL